MPLTPIAIKEYTAFINPTETPATAPSVKILKNTLGGIPTWTYNSITKAWDATLTGAFPENKTNINPTGTGPQGIIGLAYSLPFDYSYRISRVNDDKIQIEVLKTSDFSNVDPTTVLAINANLSINIQVYA